MNGTVAARVWELADPVVTHEGLELVDVEFGREQHGTVLRVFIDRAGGEGGVSLDDLTRVSRQLSDLLDVHDVVAGPYNLEVSSPGIDRRLRRPEQFRRFVGKKVRVRTAEPIDGRRVFTGTLTAVDVDGIVLTLDGGSHSIRFAEIARANYQPES